MAERSISELKDRCTGYDIYVVASGPSASFIEPSFFNNKIAIGINEVYRRFSNLDYLVRKEAIRSNQAYVTGIPLIISRHSCGDTKSKINKLDGKYDYFVFDHVENGLTEVNLDVIGTDKIVVSYSTITSAMHIAAYMGAANIILVGHDCGYIDGERNIIGYPDTPYQGGSDFYHRFLTQIEPQTVAVRERLKQVYKCNVYSLNPFVNFGLEGHRYERAS